MTVKRCAVTGEEFHLSDEEAALIRDFDLPEPTKSPRERWLEILSIQAPFNLHRSKCPKTGKSVLVRWSKRGPLGGAVDTEWFWSDECDNMAAGRPYDFNRPFFDQFVDVLKSCYAPSLNAIECENSPFVNASFNLKNCHLCFGCRQLEDCLYCSLCYFSSDLLFCIGCSKCELCYRCFDCKRLYDCRFLKDCTDCTNCYLSVDCIGCMNCYECTGLRQARDGYYYRNQKVSKEDWEAIAAPLLSGSFKAEQEALREAGSFIGQHRGYNTNYQVENCTDVHHTTGCRNIVSGSYLDGCEDCEDIIHSRGCRHVYSSIWCQNSERCYFTAASLDAYECFFTELATGAYEKYSYMNYNKCEHILGCAFLKKRSYCILNKQYSKEEYFDLVPRIIAHMKSTGEWGRWFPWAVHGVSYRNSWAHFMLGDLTDQEIADRGFLLAEEEAQTTEVGIELPDDVAEATEAHCDKQIVCLRTGKPFGIGKRDLKLLKERKIPIPRVHWIETLTSMVSGRG